MSLNYKKTRIVYATVVLFQIFPFGFTGTTTAGDRLPISSVKGEGLTAFVEPEFTFPSRKPIAAIVSVCTVDLDEWSNSYQ